MLLTDPLAPSIVTYCFIAIAAIALFSFVDRMAPNSLWPWAASTGWLLILLYDGGQTGLKPDNSNYWGEFPKEHEINAAFVMVVVWLADGLLREDSTVSRLLLWVAGACAFAVAYIEQPTPIFIGLFTVLVMASLAWRRRFRRAAEFFALACASGAGFVSNLAINYLTTGIPSDAFINLAWPVLNLQKINALGWMWPVILHSRDLAGVSGSLGHLTPSIFGEQLLEYAHLTGLRAWFGYAPGAAFASGSVIIFWIGRRRTPERMRSPVLLIASLTVSFMISAVMGAMLPDSFYRYSSFFVPVEFAMGPALWLLLGEMSQPRWARPITSWALPLMALALFAHQLWSNDGAHLKAVVKGSVQFVSGQRSIYDAYVEQADWPSRTPFGAVYPGSLAVWKELGPGPRPRVWSFHIHSYCLLPGCLWETDRSFPGSPHMFDVLFGSPDRARDILQREGLNYFLYSRDLQIRDVLPAAELFSPERIADYLGIKWTDDTTYLLTWLGPGIQPLDADWLARYRQQVSESGEVAGFRGHRVVLRAVYQQLQSNPKWGYEVKPPWLH
jgi:hypothetical protein